MNKKLRAAVPRAAKLVALGVACLAAAGLARAALARRFRDTPRRTPLPVEALRGLTQVEAARRQIAPLSPPNPHDRRALAAILRENLFSFFNLDLLTLSGLIGLLGDAQGALITFGILLLNVGLNVAQELRSRRRIEQMLRLTRTRATVVRDGRARGIEIPEVVAGDLLVVGTGDQIVADGRIVGDGQITTAAHAHNRAHDVCRRGDAVFAGDVCLAGRAAFRVTTPPDGAQAHSTGVALSLARNTASPLQRLIQRVVRLLFVLLATTCAALLIDYVRATPEAAQLLAAHSLVAPTGDIVNEYMRGVLAMAFGIAPGGLFFMIVLTYIAGTADLAELGALVRRAAQVEALAQANVLCLSHRGVLTGSQVRMEMAPERDRVLDENRVRHLFGDYIHTLSTDSVLTRALAQAFAGERRRVTAEAPLLSAYGWSAMAFDAEDLCGVFVLGDPEIVQAHLAPPKEPVGTDAVDGSPDWRARLAGWRARLARRWRTSTPDPNRSAPERIAAPDLSHTAARWSAWKDGIGRIRLRIPFRNSDPHETRESDGHQDVTTLSFAYVAGIAPLYDAAGRPVLPSNLTLLGQVHVSSQVRPEARSAVSRFVEAGMSVRILSADSAEALAETARQIGLTGRVVGAKPDTSFEPAPDPEIAQAAAVGDLTPRQKRALVAAWQRDGARVAFVGDGVGDLEALEQADLRIAMPGASQAALQMADIVLTEESPAALAPIIQRGQRLLNGLMDLVRLSLTQAGFLFLLFAGSIATYSAFPYLPKQSGIIGNVTLTIPFFLLSRWAPVGAQRGDLGRRLAIFVLPAAVVNAVTVLGVYLVLRQVITSAAYAHVLVTHLLIAMGLSLAVFVRRPSAPWNEGIQLTGDKRVVWLAAILGAAFLLLSQTPFAREYFDVYPLQDWTHYAVIGGLTLVWAVCLQGIWRSRWIRRLRDAFDLR